MKRLLQINTTVGRTAPGLIADEIDRLATAAGWECHMAYGRPGPIADDFDPATRHRLVSIFSVSWHGAMTRVADRHGLHSAGPTRRLIALIKDLRPDVIQLHNIHGYFLHYPLLFSYLRESRIPVVWTLHDLWPLTGHCAFFDAGGCAGLAHGCVDCTRTGSYPGCWFKGRAAANFRTKKDSFGGLDRLHIVAVSQWVADCLPGSILGSYPATVITNGIDIPAISRPEVSGRPLALGVAYKWNEHKGLADFIELRRLLPDRWRMRLIGLSRRQAAALPEGIEGIGRVGSIDELRRHYAEASVLVSLSHGETLGMVSLEAQACGTPVVMYAVGGCPETIAHDTGIAVSAGDVAAIARAAEAVVADPRRFSPEACRANVGARFDRAVNFSKYIDLYESLAAGL